MAWCDDDDDIVVVVVRDGATGTCPVTVLDTCMASGR